jgi:hypothetical protein
MSLRFQADADLNQTIVSGVIRREPAIDFQTAILAGLEGVSDPDVLAQVAKEDRVLVTHDRRTMPNHFAKFMTNTISPGLIVVPQSLSIATVIDDLILIWSATEVKEWKNRIVMLPL